MDELIKIHTHDNRKVISARELHYFLESKQEFSNWIKNRIKKYEFIEGEDFVRFDKVIKTTGGREIEYALTIDTAKELSMLEGNAKGKKARQYFIETEKKYQTAVTPLSTLDMMEMQVKLSREQEKKMVAIGNRLQQIEAKTKTDPEYFTIVGYATLNGISVGLKLASNLGRKATRLCNFLSLPIENIPDPRFGVVHTYPKKVLEQVFNEPIN